VIDGVSVWERLWVTDVVMVCDADWVTLGVCEILGVCVWLEL
jgi:hypothetical protein